VLKYAKQESLRRDLRMCTKSGLMVGLGERRDEIRDVFGDLREAGCDILTIGQYLSPSAEHVPVERFVTPEEFDELKRVAESMGFSAVASGPFVRSSYNAGNLFESASQAKAENAGYGSQRLHICHSRESGDPGHSASVSIDFRLRGNDR